jgi:TolB-like protein
MSTKRLRFFRLLFIGLFFSSIIAAGCSFRGGVPQWSGSGFIKKEVLEHKKVAVLPFKGDTKGEASDAFAKSFHERFPQIELVGRERLLETSQEQDLYSERIDEATRRRIGEVFGVQSLILGDIFYPSILRWLLQIQVIDVETGGVIGRSFVEINYMGAEGVKEACKIAVKNLVLR